ncbi:tyrosine--tRNA ligase, partial [Rhodococcus hoagii]|nr:tyrosine--tRNA ligase [Prescottella equi]
MLDELTWRGLIAQSTDLDALRRETEAGPVTLYAGFDPTGPSLHAGHLVPLLALKRFQRAGHRPIVLAGGATGMIGDPRDVGERVMNTADTVADWADRIRSQLERFVDFDESPTGAVIENNANWTSKLTAIDFLRDIGKHFSVNVMLARDTVKRRLETDGISYTEFSYMLLQANDFVHLRRNYGCTLQVGGSDSGATASSAASTEPEARLRVGPRHDGATRDLRRRQEVRQVHRGGSLWLDPEMTSPYAWYQYFVNTGDADVVKYLRWFTSSPRRSWPSSRSRRPNAR